MRPERKILILWFAAFVLLRAAIEVPHTDFGWIGFLNILVQVLMGLICYQVFRLSKGSQRPVWLNFTILFGMAPVLALSSYVGTSILPGDLAARFYTHLYIDNIFLPFISTLAVVYIALDYYFRTSGTGRKYLFSIVIALTVLAPFLGRDAVRPVSIFQEREWQEYRTVKWAAGVLSGEGIEPTPEAIAGKLIGNGWDGRSPAEITEKVGILSHYLVDENYTMLFWRPVQISVAGVHGVTIGIILMLLFSIYRSNRPVHAYMDKVLLIFGISESLEVFHNLAFASNNTFSEYVGLSHAAQIFTMVFFIALIGIFALKLRFLSRGAGRYYELAIASHPQETTRLIDDIDKLVLTAFFPGGKRGTLAQQHPPEKQKAET